MSESLRTSLCFAHVMKLNDVEWCPLTKAQLLRMYSMMFREFFLLRSCDTGDFNDQVLWTPGHQTQTMRFANLCNLSRTIMTAFFSLLFCIGRFFTGSFDLTVRPWIWPWLSWALWSSRVLDGDESEGTEGTIGAFEIFELSYRESL